jgi:hypothetical protein
MEELHIGIELDGLIGVYSKPTERIVLIVFAATTTDTPRTSDEATEFAVLDPADIPWAALAFWSTERALRDHLSVP